MAVKNHKTYLFRSKFNLESLGMSKNVALLSRKCISFFIHLFISLLFFHHQKELQSNSKMAAKIVQAKLRWLSKTIEPSKI